MYYVLWTPVDNVRTDHVRLKGIFSKDLSEIDNPRVVKLMERTLHYSLQIKHLPGKSNGAADALCRMGLSKAETPGESKTFFSIRSIDGLRTDQLSAHPLHTP